MGGHAHTAACAGCGRARTRARSTAQATTHTRSPPATPHARLARALHSPAALVVGGSTTKPRVPAGECKRLPCPHPRRPCMRLRRCAPPRERAPWPPASALALAALAPSLQMALLRRAVQSQHATRALCAFSTTITAQSSEAWPTGPRPGERMVPISDAHRGPTGALEASVVPECSSHLELPTHARALLLVEGERRGEGLAMREWCQAGGTQPRRRRRAYPPTPARAVAPASAGPPALPDGARPRQRRPAHPSGPVPAAAGPHVRLERSRARVPSPPRHPPLPVSTPPTLHRCCAQAPPLPEDHG